MPQTFSQLQAQIQSLQAQAEQLKQREVKDVVAKIREAITTYGLSQQDLFGNNSGRVVSPSGASQPSGRGAKAKRNSKVAKSAKYADGDGNTWVGLGKRPRWLQDALARGSRLEEFLVSGDLSNGSVGAAPEHQGASRSSKKKAGGKTAVKAMYRDDSGNSWSGRGPRPRWLKQAIEDGKTLEAMRA